MKEFHGDNIYNTVLKICSDNQYEVILGEMDYILVANDKGEHKVIEFKFLEIKTIDVIYVPVNSLELETEFYVYNGDWSGRIVMYNDKKCVSCDIGFVPISDDYKLIMTIDKEGEEDMNEMDLFNKDTDKIDKLYVYYVTIFKDRLDNWKVEKKSDTVEGTFVVAKNESSYISLSKYTRISIPAKLEVIDYCLGKQCSMSYTRKLSDWEEYFIYSDMISKIKSVLLNDMLQCVNKVKEMTDTLDNITSD